MKIARLDIRAIRMPFSKINKTAISAIRRGVPQTILKDCAQQIVEVAATSNGVKLFVEKSHRGDHGLQTSLLLCAYQGTQKRVFRLNDTLGKIFDGYKIRGVAIKRSASEAAIHDLLYWIVTQEPLDHGELEKQGLSVLYAINGSGKLWMI